MNYISRIKRRAVLLVSLLLVISCTSCQIQFDTPDTSDLGTSGTDPISTAPTTTNTDIPVVSEPPVTTQSAPVTDPAPDPQVNSVSFLAAGDNLIHSFLYLCSEDSTEEDGYNFLPIYARVADQIKAADLAYINQETMMDDSQHYSGFPYFNTPEALANDMATLGFDIVGVGNNHTLDRGCDAAANTIDKLNSLGMVTVGAYKNAEDEANIRVVTKNNIRIALLSYTYGTNMGYGGNTEFRVPLIKESKMVADLEKAEQIADFTVVFVHWGVENYYQYNQSQADAAKILAENGADVIIGTHPHVIQSVEWIPDGEGGQVLCAYSLGNLVSTMAHNFNMMGGLLSFNIVMEEGDERAHLEDPILTPTAFYYNATRDYMYVMYLQDFTDEMEQSHGVLHVWEDPIDNALLVSKYKQYIANEFRIDLYKD